VVHVVSASLPTSLLFLRPPLCSAHGQDVLHEHDVAESFANLDLSGKDLDQLETEYAEFARAMDADPSPESMDNFWQHGRWCVVTERERVQEREFKRGRES
jgi:hypothetical protein